MSGLLRRRAREKGFAVPLPCAQRMMRAAQRGRTSEMLEEMRRLGIGFVRRRWGIELRELGLRFVRERDADLGRVRFRLEED